MPLELTIISLPATQSSLTAVVPHHGFTDDMPPLRSYSLTVGMPPEWSCNMPATRQWSYSQPAAPRTYRPPIATKVVLQHACHSRWSCGCHAAQRTHRRHAATRFYSRHATKAVLQQACNSRWLLRPSRHLVVLKTPCRQAVLQSARHATKWSYSLPATQVVL